MLSSLSSRWRYLSISILFLLLVPALAACGTTTTGGGSATPKPGANVKVGLVTDIGGLNDKGFNHLAYVGLQKAEHDLGIQGAVKESHADTDYVPNLTGFATQGYNLVIAVGFLMQTAVGTVSQQFPNVKFAINDGDPSDANGNTVQRANVVGLHFKEQEAGALVGVISGMLEKAHQTKGTANTISAVGGVSIPPVNHYIAGYKWAAAMEDPGVKVLVGYSNDFTDPTKCAGVANSQIAQGADIVFQVAGGCGLGALQAAGQKGVYSIGVDTDQSSSDKSVIASAVKRVDTAAYTAIQEVVNGTFQAGMQTFDLANGGVDWAPAPGNLTLSADITAEITKVEGEIKAGTVTVPDTIPA
jgi:basic membrane protein A